MTAKVRALKRDIVALHEEKDADVAEGLFGEEGDEVGEVAGDGGEEFVHQFGLLHFGDVGNGLAASSGEPACFGVGTATTRED